METTPTCAVCSLSMLGLLYRARWIFGLCMNEARWKISREVYTVSGPHSQGTHSHGAHSQSTQGTVLTLQ